MKAALNEILKKGAKAFFGDFGVAADSGKVAPEQSRCGVGISRRRV